MTGRRSAAAVLIVALLAGCAGASNSGGDTSCADFLSKRDADKDATVARMLKERNGRNSSTSDVQVKRAALVVICQGGDKQSSKIGELG